MEEDYIKVIESFRDQGRSDNFIFNSLVFGNEYGLEPDRARALIGASPKKKENFTIAGSLDSKPSDIALDSSLEEGQRSEAAYASPSIDDTKLDPSIKQWRDYSLSTGINMDVNMYDAEDMRMAYAQDAVDWSISNNKFEEGITSEDILGNNEGKKFDPEKVAIAQSEYANFFEENKEKVAELQVDEEQMKQREAASRSLSIVKEYSKRMEQDFKSAHENLMRSNQAYRDKVTKIQKKAKSGEIDELVATREIKRFFNAYSAEFFSEKLDTYRDEIINSLPPEMAEDEEFLEDLSEDIYDRTNGQMKLNLDRDGVYNEDTFFLASMFAGMAATTIDMTSGVLSSAMGLAGPLVGEDSEDFGFGFYRTFQDAADKLRGEQRDYSGDYEGWDVLNRVGHFLGDGLDSAGEMVPYIFASAVPGALFTTGVMNTYVDSKVTDQDRINEGLDPIFGYNDPKGEAARFFMSVGVGAVQEYSKGILQRVGGRFIGKAGAGSADRFISKVLGGTAGEASKGRALSAYLLGQGVDAVKEGGQEVIENAIQRAAEVGLGNSDLTMSEFLAESQMSFVEGVKGTAGIAVAGAPVGGVRAGRDILGVSSDIITGPQAATNSIADPSSVDAEEGSDAPVLSNIDRETYGKTPEEIKKHKLDNEKRYRVIRLRHPKAFEKIQKMDERLMTLAHTAEAIFAKAEDVNVLNPQETERLEAAQREFKSLIEARHRLFSSFKNESTALTEAEAISVERAQIAKSMGDIDLDIRITREEMQKMKEEEGTLFYDGDAYAEMESKLEELKARQATARKLVGELEAASKADAEARSQSNVKTKEGKDPVSERTSEAVRVAQTELLDFLGLTNQPFDSESEAQTSSAWSAENQSKNHFEDEGSKGSTYTLDGVNQAGKPKASVSIFNERSEVVDGEMNEEEMSKTLQEFYEKNKDILEGNEDILAIGTFYDAESGKTYIDISSVLDKDIAARLGKEYNQISVWDLELMKEIKTGGDGTVKGEMKPEADRISDIRNILDEEAKRQKENQVEAEGAEQTNQDVDQDAARANRGIEGQYKDYAANKDGSVGVVAEGPLKREMAKWINSKLPRTIKNIIGEGKNLKIRVHNTAESGHFADGQGGGKINGYYVETNGKDITIHVNPEFISQKMAESGKTLESVMLEELQHVMVGPILNKIYLENPALAKKMVEEMFDLARLHPDKDLVAQIEAKRDEYMSGLKVSTEEKSAIVFEEMILELTSELAGVWEGVSAKQKKSFFDKLRVWFNKAFKAAGANEFVIKDITSVEQLVEAMSAIHNRGAGVSLDARVENRIKTNERAAYSKARPVRVQSLPEEGAFSVRYTKPIYGRRETAGIVIDNVLAQSDFNGKWHFVNWWKTITKMGQDRHGGWEVRMEGETEFKPLDADAMKKWKMKPPRKRMGYREQREAEQKAKVQESRAIRDLQDEFSEGTPYEQQQQRKKAIMTAAVEVFGEEEVQKRMRTDNRLNKYFSTTEYSSEELTKIRMKLEENYGLRKPEERDDLTTQRASLYVKDMARRQGQSDQERLKELEDELRKIVCGGVAFDCPISKEGLARLDLMRIISESLKGKKRTPEVMAQADATLLEWAHIMRRDRTGRDIRDIHEEIKQVHDKVSDLIEEIHPPSQIPPNHRSHFGVFTSILSATSNGVIAEKNLRVAILIYDKYLTGIANGNPPSKALPMSFKKGIRDANTEVILNKGDINEQRAGNVVRALDGILAKADEFYDPETGVLDSEAMGKHYGRKKRGKDRVQASAILGANAEKTGEHAAGMMGVGDRSFLSNERWERRWHHALQGNLVVPAEYLVVSQDAIKAAESVSEQFEVTESEITDVLSGFVKVDGSPLTESDYGWSHPAVRAVAAMKAVKASNRGKKAKDLASKRLYVLLARDSVYDNGSSFLEVDDKLIRETRRETVKEMNRRFRNDGTGKEFNVYHLQQLGWESMTAEMAAMKEGELKDMSYAALIDGVIDGLKSDAEVDLSLEDSSSQMVASIDNMGNITRERAQMSFDFPATGRVDDEVLAHESPLYRNREIKDVGMVKQKDGFAPMTDALVEEALKTDKRSMQIMDENNPVEDGKRVAIRLNLNVKKNTGVPVQTVHEKTATGKALRYSGAVTLKNVELAVNQSAREKIVTFQENKFPMAAVQGDYVSEGVEASELDGVKAVFNPFREHLFVDASGRAIKSAEEATVIGNNVILRGKIEYFKMDDPILQRGKVESDKGKAKRLLRGDRYEKQLKRFKAYAEGALGMTFNNRAELEAAYDGMQVGSKVALSESEVAENMETARERASIGGFIKQNKMRQTARKQAGTFLNTTREAIISNPENYIKPQSIKKIKSELEDMTDQELVNHLTDESVGRLSERNDDVGVLAGAEMLRRAIARGETDRIPAIVAELAAVGTTAGRILRHFRELKSSTPKGLASIIESAVTNNGNQLSDAQKAELKKVTEDLFVQQAKVEELMRRAVGGEQVDAELESAIDDMKATERKLDTFTTKYVEKSWGTLFGQLVQGNLLTTISQMFNIGANMVNAVAYVATDILSLPFEAAMMKIGKAMGKNIEDRRKASLMAYVYGFRKFGAGFVEAADQIVTGQDKEFSEWRVHRGLAPFRSLKAAFQKDLPLGPDGKGSLSQRSKLFVQGTLGIPAEVMFRLLSLGDTPFRRFAEGVDLYQSAKSMGLEGEALARYLKYPSKRDLERAKREGRKLTFQEETAASKNVNSIVAALEGMVSRGIDSMGMNGQDFAKALFKTMLPYRSTPANILYETFTWVNPYVGTVRMANQLRNGEVEESSKTLAKMMLGAVTMEAALMLISEGIISGPVKWDEDEEKNMAYDVFPPSSVNISALRRLINGEDPAHQADDYFFKYDKLGMFGAVMSTAVQSTDAETLREREYSSPTQFFSHTISDFFGAGSVSAISAMMEQSFVQGLNGFIKVLIGDNVERDLEAFLSTMFKAGSAAILPNQMNAFYRSSRGYLPDSRLTRDVGDQGGVIGLAERLSAKFSYTIRDRTFGLADYPVRVNWKGEDIQQTPIGASPIAYQLFDITKSRQGSADPLSNEIWRLYEQTEAFTDVCGTPSYASTRKLNVPNITSKKDIKMVRDLGRGYTWVNDEEFMAESVYLSTSQINELMKIGGKERYKDALELTQTKEYKDASDEDKIDMLNDVADNFNSAKEYGPNGYRRHTIKVFDFLQEIYDGREEV